MARERSKLSLEEIVDLRTKAKDSQLLTPTPEQIEFRKKLFDEIDAATVESGIVLRLHELTERLTGEKYKIVVFDTVELSVGTPFPVPTRYVSLMTDDDIKDFASSEEVDEKVELPEFLPGLVVRRWPAGMTNIQIGMDIKADVFKLSPRFEAVSHHWRNGESFSKPYWWPYEIPAEDVTQEYDLMVPVNLNVALIYSDNMDRGLGYFTTGGREYISKVEDVRYSEKSGKDRELKVVWNQNKTQERVTKGLKYLETYFINV